MTKRWPVLLACAVALGVSACGRQEPSEAPATRESAPQDGSPQMVSTVDGVHIQYRIYGEGEPVIVLVHGWSCDSSYWSAQVDALRKAYTVVTVDLAGHGASGRNRTDWSMSNYGEDVAAVVRQLPNRQVILVGHSMGGPIVLEAAPRIGDRVVGIIGVDTLKTIGQPPIPQEMLEKYLAPFRADFIGYTRQYVTDTFFTQSADEQLVKRIAEDMSQAPPEVAIPSIEGMVRMDMDAALARISVPIVAINSDLGAPTDEARIRNAVPTFRAIVMRDVGHFPMMEDPKRFNSILLKEIAALAKDTRD